MIMYEIKSIAFSTVDPGGGGEGEVVEAKRYQNLQTKKTISRTYQIIWYVLGVFESLLLLRLFLKVFAANPRSYFAAFIYGISSPLVRSFIGVFPVTAVEGSVFEWSTVLAMIIYVILAAGLVRVLQLVKPVKKAEIERVVDSQ